MKKPTLPSLSRIKKALYADWSLRVRSRDGFKCLLCGATENLTAHHFYCSDHHAHAARYAIANGATLCYACHIRGIHTRADYVSVMRLAEALKLSNEDMLGISQLVNMELTTGTLRELWDGMRRRPINIDKYAVEMVTKSNGGMFVTFLEEQHPVAVVGNTVTTCIHDMFEVAVVTKTEGGYRYTLKKLEDGE